MSDFQYTLQKQLNDIVEMKKEKFVYEEDFFQIEQHVALMIEDLQMIKESPLCSVEKENLREYVRTTYHILLGKLKSLFHEKKYKEIDKLWNDYGVALFSNKSKYPSLVILKVEGVLLPIK